jgi:acyl-CoA reductase-like NAD-dependent aldehyde dehydrogenase
MVTDIISQNISNSHFKPISVLTRASIRSNSFQGTAKDDSMLLKHKSRHSWSNQFKILLVLPILSLSSSNIPIIKQYSSNLFQPTMGSSDYTFETFFNVVNGECRSAFKFKHGTDPSTGKKLWDWPVATTNDVEEAVQSANDAFNVWSTTPIEQRVEKISEWKESYKGYCENFTKLLMAECGKTRALAAGEANEVISLFEHHLQLHIPEERIEDDHRIITTRHVPVGVVAAICPWNFPVVLSMGKILAAVLSGCCIIVKPSPFTPYSALKLVELAQPFFPPGVIQVLGGDDLLGPALVSHPDIHKISFTGSSATGKKIMQSAAGTMKRVTLEL